MEKDRAVFGGKIIPTVEIGGSWRREMPGGNEGGTGFGGFICLKSFRRVGLERWVDAGRMSRTCTARDCVWTCLVLLFELSKGIFSCMLTGA